MVGRSLVALLIVVGVCASAIALGAKQRTNNVETPLKGQTGQGSKAMDITPYRIKDEDFWNNSDRGSDKLAGELVGKHSGPLVDAPRRIPIDKRSTFPMGVYHMGPIRELAAAPFKKFGLVTAMDVTANRLYVSSAQSFDPDSDPIPGPPVDTSKLPDGDECSTSSFELRSVMKLPWQPSRYLLTAIVRDKASNRAPVELCKSPSCYIDPEVVKHQAAQLAKVNPSPVEPRPGDPLPSYRKLADSLGIPDQPGIALAATRLVEAKRAEPWLIQGAYRLTALPQETVKPGWTDPYFAGHPGETAPVAVVTIHLLMTGADDGSIYLWPLKVPSWSRQGSEVTGYFAFDLRQLRGKPTRPETYFVYAFSGASMAGPIPAALVGSP